MKLHHTLLAAALLALAAPAAFANGDDADIYSDWDMYNSIYVTGDIYAGGYIHVKSESGALVDQDQLTLGDYAAGDGDNTATVDGSAMIFNSQATAANVGTDNGSPDNQLFYDATVTDDALSGASGNIGLNVAAGVGNAQTNALAASVNSSGTIAKASADSQQFTLFNSLAAECDLDNTALLSGNALSGAVGNIGVNIAAGVGNAQHNGLAIAVAACELCD